MIGCVEFTFNASFFCLGWRRLSWYALFLISIRYQWYLYIISLISL